MNQLLESAVSISYMKLEEITEHGSMNGLGTAAYAKHSSIMATSADSSAHTHNFYIPGALDFRLLPPDSPFQGFLYMVVLTEGGGQNPRYPVLQE